MSKVKIISPKESLIERAGEVLLKSSEISANLAVFPNRRPGYFLNLYLYERLGKPFAAPEIFSIDDFIERIFEKMSEGKKRSFASEMDLAAMLYEDFESYSMDITGIKKEDFTLDFFMPWAKKLIGDFEELKINRLRPSDIRDFDYLIRQEDEKQGGSLAGLDGLRDKYARFSELYGRFYEKCLLEGMYTRSMKYDFIASRAAELVSMEYMQKYENIIFAGFFALTASEKEIFEAIYGMEKSIFIYTASPLLEKNIPFKVEIPKTAVAMDGRVCIKKTGGVHEQVMEFKKDLMAESDVESLNRESAIILPDCDMILPVLENVLVEIEKFNISAGYPLKMTPVYSMLEALFGLLSSLSGEKRIYNVSEYLSFVMHPYVKNLNTAGSPEETRKLFQNLRDGLARLPFLSRLSLDELEEISGAPEIKEIHDKLIRPFEAVKNIGDFADKLVDVVDFISENSTASKHPYWNYFPAIICEKLREVSCSRLARIKFSSNSSYFTFMKDYLSGSAHPFRGSPVEGFQCLGFLEGRNLKFKNLFILDVNDGLLPAVKKEDSILPFRIREKLKLSTYKTACDIYAYYFENLVLSAEKVWLYYIDDKNREASPLLEKLRWELEKKGNNISEKSPVLRINFKKSEPEPIKKTPEMKKELRKMIFNYTSINAYLKCQLSFYYRYILELKENKLPIEEVDGSDIGEIFHKILESYFLPRMKVKFRPEELQERRKEIVLQARALLEKRFPSESGLEYYMIKSQILRRVSDFIDFHFKRHISFSILSCEKNYFASFKVSGANVSLMARIDRVDERTDGICLVDYKTSASDAYHLPNEELSEEDLNGDILKWGPMVGSLQLPLYIRVYRESEKLKRIFSSIITLGSKEIKENILFSQEESDDKLRIFYRAIDVSLEDILNKDFFLPPLDERPCANCPYKTICGRQWVKSNRDD